MKRIFGVTVLVALLAAGLVVVWQELREAALVRSGACQVVEEEMYRPAPTYRTIGEVRTLVHRPPYLRALWGCESGETFWRRVGW